MPLSEQRRTQIDQVVMKMTSDGQPAEAIQAVVNDFKNKYEGEAGQKEAGWDASHTDPNKAYWDSIGKTAGDTVKGVAQGLNPINLIRGPLGLAKDLYQTGGVNAVKSLGKFASDAVTGKMEPQEGGQMIGNLLLGAAVPKVAPMLPKAAGSLLSVPEKALGVVKKYPMTTGAVIGGAKGLSSGGLTGGAIGALEGAAGGKVGSAAMEALERVGAPKPPAEKQTSPAMTPMGPAASNPKLDAYLDKLRDTPKPAAAASPAEDILDPNTTIPGETLQALKKTDPLMYDTLMRKFGVLRVGPAPSAGVPPPMVPATPPVVPAGPVPPVPPIAAVESGRIPLDLPADIINGTNPRAIKVGPAPVPTPPNLIRATPTPISGEALRGPAGKFEQPPPSASPAELDQQLGILQGKSRIRSFKPQEGPATVETPAPAESPAPVKAKAKPTTQAAASYKGSSKAGGKGLRVGTAPEDVKGPMDARKSLSVEEQNSWEAFKQENPGVTDRDLPGWLRQRNMGGGGGRPSVPELWKQLKKATK